jgi:hypothetical protein
MDTYEDYIVWTKLHDPVGLEWDKTHHVIKARTDKEARYKLRGSFKNMGLSRRSLIPILDGDDPNEE